MTRCEACGHVNTPGTAACSACGEPIGADAPRRTIFGLAGLIDSSAVRPDSADVATTQMDLPAVSAAPAAAAAEPVSGDLQGEGFAQRTLFGVPSPARSGAVSEALSATPTAVGAPAPSGSDLTSGGLPGQSTRVGRPGAEEMFRTVEALPPARTLIGAPHGGITQADILRAARMMPGGDLEGLPPEETAPLHSRASAVVLHEETSVAPSAREADPPRPASAGPTRASPGEAAPIERRAADGLADGVADEEEGRERDREAAEAYAAARFAAAIAREQRGAARHRLRAAIGIGATVLVLGAVVAFLALREERAFRAELASDLSVTAVGGRYRVGVTVRASQPSTVVYPGGQQAFEEQHRLVFEVSESSLSVGDNLIELEVVPNEGAPKTLTLHVTVYYRMVTPPRSAPQAGKPVIAELVLIPGWTTTVEGGQAIELEPGRARLEIDPAPLLERVDGLDGTEGDLPVRFTLRSPDGRSEPFVESLRLPLPITALTIWSPPRGWAGGQNAPIEGRATPAAKVRVGAVETVADAEGRFSLSVPVEPGRRELVVEADAPQARPISRKLTVEALTDAERRARLAALRQQARKERVGSKRSPSWETLMADATALAAAETVVTLSGRLLSARRSEDGEHDALQVAICRRDDGCPIWVDATGPLFVEAGDRVQIHGVVTGTTEYATRGGEKRTVPRLRARFVLP